MSSQVSIDVDFINPFILSTLNVLKVQAATTATHIQIYKKDPKEKFSGDISGIIGIVSDSFNGSIVISFHAKTFLTIMNRMLGENYTEINKDIEDGAGEITNMIFGGAKNILNQKGLGIKTAVPMVVSGKEHSVQNTSNAIRVVVPFDSDAGEFWIEIFRAE